MLLEKRGCKRRLTCFPKIQTLKKENKLLLKRDKFVI